MFYDAELSFLRNTLDNFHLQTLILSDEDRSVPDIDMGLRSLLGIQDANASLCAMIGDISPNTIYRITDYFHCNYFLLLLPKTDPHSYLIIGPYLDTDITDQILYPLVQHFSAGSTLITQLKKYYSRFPMIPDERLLFAMLTAFGQKLWGDMENFSVKTIDREGDEYTGQITQKDLDQNLSSVSSEVLEERYDTENQIIQAVSQGQYHKAQLAYGRLSVPSADQHNPGSLRDMKNYCIIMNTLLRKAAEAGAVHPLHVERLSSEFDRKIELISTPEAGIRLQKEMIRKYCLLVRNYSLKGYSLLVRKVLIHIDSDLTADLSLNSQARLLNVNASYLSTLFKKEMGCTLTEYVNRKRIDQAIFLLNSTPLQIQTIAQQCGIPDVNYFTKTFKKYIGMTPREYRDNILPKTL